MIRTKEGAIKPLPDNYLRLFRAHPAMEGVLGYDLRTDRAVLLKAPPWAVAGAEHYPRSIRDTDDVEAAAWANRIGLHTSAVSQISGALSAAATANPFDRVVDWLEGLPAWDRTPRLYQWLPKVTGCRDTLYSRGVGGKFILSMVARAYDPGCKVDSMLTLVGPQGGYKSTLLRAVASGPGAWAFNDCLGDIRKPQDYMPTLMGPWLVEVAELSAFTRKEVESVKKFLSTQTDRYRMSYGRRAVDIPRRGCVAGTSNTDDFLSDATGNRRFWPIDVRKLDVGAFVAEREQIFAEAVFEYRNGKPWYLEGEEVALAIAEQERHTVIDTWEDPIRLFLDEPPVLGPTNPDAVAQKMETTHVEIARDCLQIPTERVSQGHSRRIAGILKRLGWRKARPLINGRRVYVWRRPVETLEVEDDQ
jgi:predicted P-loop ATPase